MASRSGRQSVGVVGTCYNGGSADPHVCWRCMGTAQHQSKEQATMRYTVGYAPVTGDTRTKRVFAWWPTYVEDQLIWLESYWRTQRYTSGSGPGEAGWYVYARKLESKETLSSAIESCGVRKWLSK